MNSNVPNGLTRRGLLRMGAVISAALALPAQLWAAMARPESAFKATAIEDVFAELGGTPEASEGIVFSTPDIAENGAVVPVKVEIDTAVLPNVSRLYVLVEKNPNPVAALFDVPANTQPYVETRVKVAQTCDLYAVAEMDGKLFMTKRETKVTLGGCGG